MRSYDNLRQFLTRLKVENPGHMTLFLFEKYIDSNQPTEYKNIRSNELKIKKIIPSKSYANFASWRIDMTNKGILICMANKHEIRDSDANFKASMFRYGPTIKKYIEAALEEKASIFERLDAKADVIYVEEQLKLKANVEDLSALGQRIDEDIASTKQELNMIKLELQDLKENYENMLLYFLPPDNERRRKIVQRYLHNKDLCIEMLKLDSKKVS